jgi:penicillin-insensitive murein DD-endopeptidase
MKRNNKNNKCLFFHILTAIVTIALFASHNAQAEQPAEIISRGTVSLGTPMRGNLERGEVLPRTGNGYVLTRTTRQRKARFGVTELIALIKQAAFKVNRKYKGSLLRVADLSARKGGSIEHHGSHQNGRDVDLLFYLLDKNGRNDNTEEFIPIDANGFSTEPPMTYRFDVKRNWALIEALLRSKKAIVQWIFISQDIKALLIAHAKKNGASKRIIRMAGQVLKQPGKKAHMDHFHVRIYCPKSDRPACEDVGPRWAWRK